jgi:regulator of replication initiation timing
METSGRQRMEEVVGRAAEALRRLRDDAEAERKENERLRAEVVALRDRLGELRRAAVHDPNSRELRRVEKERRELRGRLTSLLRLADSLMDKS